MKVASDHYKNQDYNVIQNIIKEADLEVSITTIRDLNVMQNDFVITRDIRSKNVSKEFYNIGTSNRGDGAEWTVTISGNYSYDASTYRITSVTRPTVSLTESTFGSAFSPYITNINASSSYSGSTATFTGRYTMMAEQTTILGTRITHNYGSKTHTVTGHPLQ